MIREKLSKDLPKGKIEFACIECKHRYVVGAKVTEQEGQQFITIGVADIEKMYALQDMTPDELMNWMTGK